MRSKCYVRFSGISANTSGLFWDYTAGSSLDLASFPTATTNVPNQRFMPPHSYHSVQGGYLLWVQRYAVASGSRDYLHAGFGGGGFGMQRRYVIHPS